jgi:hypothetical protein
MPYLSAGGFCPHGKEGVAFGAEMGEAVVESRIFQFEFHTVPPVFVLRSIRIRVKLRLSKTKENIRHDHRSR